MDVTSRVETGKQAPRGEGPTRPWMWEAEGLGHRERRSFGYRGGLSNTELLRRGLDRGLIVGMKDREAIGLGQVGSKVLKSMLPPPFFF